MSVISEKGKKRALLYLNGLLPSLPLHLIYVRSGTFKEPKLIIDEEVSVTKYASDNTHFLEDLNRLKKEYGSSSEEWKKSFDKGFDQPEIEPAARIFMNFELFMHETITGLLDSIEWRTIHALIFNLTLGLAELDLPYYVMLWTFDFIEPISSSRVIEAKKIDHITGIMKSIQRIKFARTIQAKKQAITLEYQK